MIGAHLFLMIREVAKHLLLDLWDVQPKVYIVSLLHIVYKLTLTSEYTSSRRQPSVLIAVCVCVCGVNYLHVNYDTYILSSFIHLFEHHSLIHIILIYHFISLLNNTNSFFLSHHFISYLALLPITFFFFLLKHFWDRKSNSFLKSPGSCNYLYISYAFHMYCLLLYINFYLPLRYYCYPSLVHCWALAQPSYTT